LKTAFFVIIAIESNPIHCMAINSCNNVATTMAWVVKWKKRVGRMGGGANFLYIHFSGAINCHYLAIA